MEIAIAAGISVLVEVVKRVAETTHLGTVTILFAASLFAAAGYSALQATGLWTSFYHFVIEAAGIYALILQYYPKSN